MSNLNGVRPCFVFTVMPLRRQLGALMLTTICDLIPATRVRGHSVEGRFERILQRMPPTFLQFALRHRIFYAIRRPAGDSGG